MLPRNLAEFLVASGHEAQTRARIKIGSSADDALWQYADKENAVLISTDADFLPMTRDFSKTQFVHLKKHGLSTAQLLKKFSEQFSGIQLALESGERFVEVWLSEYS